MASDCLYVDKATPTRSQMFHIAHLCHVSLGDAFMAWFRLWSWLDGATSDGHLKRFKPEDCDDLGRLPGFGAALAEVQWIKFGESETVICYWGPRYGASARKRAARHRRFEKYQALKAERERIAQNAQ